MDVKEFKLYQQLENFGLNFEQMELLPFRPTNIVPFDEQAFILESPLGNRALWIHKGREAGLVRQIQLLEICKQQGLKGFLYPLELSDGRTYARFGLESWCYLTPWPATEKVYFSQEDHLKLIVKLLVDFRTAVTEGGFLFYSPDSKSGNLLQKFPEILKQLHTFKLLSCNRLKPTIFDRFFLNYVDEIIRQTEQALDFFEKSDYGNLIAELNPRNVIVNKLTRHNLRLFQGETAVCLRLDDCQWDLPIIDLAILLIKSGRSAKWDMQWFRNVLNEYQKYYRISPGELEIIYAYLAFPWGLYRLASRYYYNRVNWPLGIFVEKLKRLLADERKRIQFINNLRSL